MAQTGFEEFTTLIDRRENDRRAIKDRRSDQRKRIFKKGLVTFKKEHSSVECIIRDISNFGAKIKFNDIPFSIPREFTLHLPSEGIVVECETVWSEGVGCGVRFMNEVDIRDTISPDMPIFDATKPMQSPETTMNDRRQSSQDRRTEVPSSLWNKNTHRKVAFGRRK